MHQAYPPGLRRRFAGDFMKRLIVIVLVIILTGCSSIPPITWPFPTPTSLDQMVSATETPLPVFSAEPKSTASLTETSIPVMEMEKAPVIPEVLSQKVIDLYRKGQELGNNPGAFSVIGDCDSTPTWFLGDFDRGPGYYSLGEYKELRDVIEVFKGSFAHANYTVKRGFNTAAILSPFWADPKYCLPGESPLDCELRTNRPSFAFILLGTNDIYSMDGFEKNLRSIIDDLEAHGVVPILSTKADDLEGGNRINAIIIDLAEEYEIPLWNFWKAVQTLPDHGLQADGAHLTWANNWFDNPASMQKAWPWRNLTALQVLDFVWKGVTIH